MKKSTVAVVIASAIASTITAAALATRRKSVYTFLNVKILPKEKWIEKSEQVTDVDGFFEHRVAAIGSIMFRKGLMPILVPVYLIEKGPDTACIISMKSSGKPLYVNVNETFISLPENHQKAILLHEAGHVVNEASGVEVLSNENLSERVYENELAADKFAASIIGAEEYCDALWALAKTHESVDAGVEELYQRAADLGDEFAKDLLEKFEEITAEENSSN